MTLELITLEGFLSYKQEQTIDLSGLHVCLVNGAINGDISRSNGAGKSGLFESVCVCFFGKTGGRSDILDRYINDFCSGFRIEVVFSIDGKQWKAVRIKGRGKTGSFSLFFKSTDGWKLSEFKIEEVLGLSFLTYGSTVYLSERESLKFISGTSSERKEILRELLNIEIFEEASKKANKMIQEADRKFNINTALIESKNNQIESEGPYDEPEAIENEIKLIKTIIEEDEGILVVKRNELKTSEIENEKRISVEKAVEDENERFRKGTVELKSMNELLIKIVKEGKECSQRIEEAKGEIGELEEEIKTLETEASKIVLPDEGLSKKLEDLRTKSKSLNKKLSEKNSESTKIETEKGQIERLIQKVKKFGSACPVIEEKCSVITESYRNQFEKTKNDEIKESDDKLNIIVKEIVEIEEDINKNESAEKKILKAIDDGEMASKKHRRIQNEITTKSKEVSSIKEEMARLEGGIVERREAYSKTEEDIEKLNGEIEEIKNKIKEYKEELEGLKQIDTTKLEKEIEGLEDSVATYSAKVTKYTGELAVSKERKTRVETLKKDIEELMVSSNKLKDEREIYYSLVKIFGKDGIQKSVMKDAVPALEETAKELLKIFSDGSDKINVRFELDPKRADGELKSEGGLDIIVLEAGKEPKDLSMYSGGETVRIVFSIVLALAKLLSKRSGKRQETLVIDEKIAKLDPCGIEQFIEIIKIISSWYKKVFIITHISSLKDLLENNSEIFINKTVKGSVVEVRK